MKKNDQAVNYLSDTTIPLEIRLSKDILNKLEEKYNVYNLLIVYFPVTIGPVPKFYLRKTKFIRRIMESPNILGEITIMGKYAKAIKLRDGEIIYLKDLRIGNTLLMLMIETTSISKKTEEFLEILTYNISKKGELDPIRLADVLSKLVSSIEHD